jgi:transposase
MSKPWSKKEETRLAKLCGEGLTAREIAKAMKRTYNSVREKIKATEGLRVKPEKRKAPKKTLEQHATEERLKGDLRRTKGQLKKALVKIATLAEIRELVASACSPLEPLVHKVKFRKDHKGEKSYTAVALVSDWQIGEVISEEESGGWGVFDHAIATARAMKYGEKIVEWVTTQRSGYKIDKLRVFVLGDMVSGNIHEELRETNEWPAPVASVMAGELLAQLLGVVAPHFQVVEVEYVGSDNHGRLTKKPRYKLAAEDSFNYIVYAMAKARLEKHENVVVRLHKANPTLIDLEGSGVLAMHGHGMKSWMGIPFYGIQRFQGRKAKMHMERNRPFKLMICGHWHAPAEVYGCIINGCLSGTTELDHNVGRNAPPSQTTFLWHPKYGQFNKTNWDL